MNQQRLVILIVSIAMFMEALDTTIINTAIPVMAKSLAVNPINLKIALISYLLGLAIFIPISGWMADRYGAKRVFLLAISVFTLSSLWCGFASHLQELTIARFIQGIGGALSMPVGRLIILRSCKRHEFIGLMNWVVMIAGLGMMLGPLLGGLITTWFSWHWIFWVNIPIGLLNLYLIQTQLPDFHPRTRLQLDSTGFILFGLGLALLTLSLSLLSEFGVRFRWPLTLLLLSGTILYAYTHHRPRRRYPVVKMRLFQVKTFHIAVMSNLITRLSFGGIPFLMPLLLQVILGHSPAVSGLLLAPLALGILTVKPFSLRLLRHFGYKKLLLLNTWVICLCLLFMSLISANSSLFGIACLTYLFGFLLALQYGAMNSLAYANIEERHISAATSIMGTVQQLAQSFGIAVAALLINLFSHWLHTDAKLSLMLFQLTFITLAGLTALASLIFLRLNERDGAEMIQHTDV